MPSLDIDRDRLAVFGRRWTENGSRLSRTRPESSLELGDLFDSAVGTALAQLLGGISIRRPTATQLQPTEKDCVEVGPVRVIGGVRPQNFDVGYRPDGVRFAFDSKTLNDRDSVRKNYQNMINDIATEATTVHSRFPYAVVAFLVAVPEPCLVNPQAAALIGTLERLAGRSGVDEPEHVAEAISLVVWRPEDGSVSPAVPAPDSPLRYERFSPAIERVYTARYKGLPPHADTGD